MKEINESALPSRATGFSLHLEGAHIADLIQIACQNRTQSAFQLTSPQGQAQLYFGSGKLLHAQCKEKKGLSAVVEILQWEMGQATAMGANATPEETIGMEANALLLRAAQRQDEQAHSESCNPAARTALEPTTSVVRKFNPAESEEIASCEPKVTVRPPPLPTLPPMGEEGFRSTWAPGSITLPPPPRLPNFGLSAQPVDKSQGSRSPLRVVKLSSTGSVERRTGGADQDLVDRVFCASRIVASLGNKLGLGACKALHLRGEDSSLIVSKSASITGVEGCCEAVYPVARKLKVL